MTEEFLILKKEIELLQNKENIICFLLYGSILNNRNDAKDLDGVVIVKEVNENLNNLFILLKSKYKKLDFNIYTEEEVKKDISYYTREFKLEYLSKALCVYGKNILEDKFTEVDNFKYKQSILIRSIEHMQLVRQKYFFSNYNESEKIKYLNKYLFRIFKNIILFKGRYNHTEVNKLSEAEILEKLSGFNILEHNLNYEEIKSEKDYFEIFDMISQVLIKLKKEL